jgi:hypothetical protein
VGHTLGFMWLRQSTLVDFSGSFQGNLEGKPGTLYLGFHFSILYFSWWNPNVGREHYVFVVNHNYELGYMNC